MADIDSGGDKNFTFMTMKTNYWLILGVMIAASAVAQTNTLPPIPAPLSTPPTETAPAVATPVVEPKPVPVKHKKPAAAPKRVALNEPTVTLLPGTAEVTVSNLLVRGHAGLKGEVIEKLTKGDIVTVISQSNLTKHAVGEPAQWAKIALPGSTKIWLNSSFVNPLSKKVVVKKLNLRAGPGENYSVLGTIERGTVVSDIKKMGAWMQIEPPASAYAYVAAMYLKQEASGTVSTNPVPSMETEPVTTPVAETQPIVTEPTNGVVDANIPEVAMTTPDLATSAAMIVDTNPPPPRVVSHEGVVGVVDSLIAPTAYVLYDPSTRKEINYLYTTSTNLDISRYYKMRIIATGEEAMAERWPNTPVLTIQRIEVLQTNTTQKIYYPAPRQHH